MLEVHREEASSPRSGTPIVTLADVAQPYVDVFVPQADVDQAGLGGQVQIHVDASTSPSPAHVEYIGRRTEFTPRVPLHRARAAQPRDPRAGPRSTIPHHRPARRGPRVRDPGRDEPTRPWPASSVDAEHLSRRFGDLVAVEDVIAAGRARARCSACSGPTAPASRRPSACCAGCSIPSSGSGRRRRLSTSAKRPRARSRRASAT